MKKIYLLPFLLCLSLFLSAQKEHNVWYFGYNAGVTFNSGSPVALTGGQTATTEGVATICDTAGNLLFYTEGTYVWGRNNVIMPNGTGLLGGPSSTESAIILKQPGSANLYYIFTAPEQNSNNPVAYSIVDMTLNGGNGDVTIKNSPLVTPATEKLTYVRHANGTDYWIICHGYNSSSFYAYLFSATGVNSTAVISTTGIYQGGFSNNVIGYLKPSPCGDKLASALWQMDSLEIFDFDKSTGIVSNGYTLSGFTASSGVYGVEFSPGGRFLYCSVITPAYVYQFDMNAGSLAAIAASKTLIGTSANNFNGGLQTGPDGKIYMVEYTSANLAVINYPDSAGLSCNFVDNAVPLGINSGTLGLPNYTADQFCTAGIPPVSAFISSDTTFCSETGMCINFFDRSTGNPTSWQWYFPGANPDTSSMQNPDSICYFNPGTYPVTLIVSNSFGTDTLAVTPLIIYATAPLPPTVTVQGGDTLVSSHAFSYQWYYNGFPLAGATDSFYVTMQGGTYAVRINDSLGCSVSSGGVLITGIDSIVNGAELNIFPNPVSKEFDVAGLNLRAGNIMEIYNFIGEQVYEKRIEPANLPYKNTINITTLCNGIYLLKIISEQGTLSRKFVVMH